MRRRQGPGRVRRGASLDEMVAGDRGDVEARLPSRRALTSRAASFLARQPQKNDRLSLGSLDRVRRLLRELDAVESTSAAHGAIHRQVAEGLDVRRVEVDAKWPGASRTPQGLPQGGERGLGARDDDPGCSVASQSKLVIALAGS